MEEKDKNAVLGVVLMIAPVLVMLLVSGLISVMGSVIYGVIFAIKASVDGTNMYDMTAMQEGLEIGDFIAVLSLIADIIVALIAFFWWRKIRRIEVPVSKAFKLKKIGFLVMCGIGLQVIVSLCLGGILSILPESISEEYEALSEGLTGTGTTSIPMFLLVVFAAPICEDLIIRGVALNYGRRHMSDIAAVIISSLAFGLMHLSNASLTGFAGVMVQVIYATVLGVVLAIIVIKFKSVWAGVFTHFIINLTGQLLSLLQGKETVETVGTVVFYVLGALSVVGVILMLKLKIVTKTEGETYGEINDKAMVAEFEN